MNISTSTCVLTTNVAGILQGMTSVSPITIYMHYHFNETMMTFYSLFLISQTEAPWHPCIFSHLISHVANKIPHPLESSFSQVKVHLPHEASWFPSNKLVYIKTMPCLLVLNLTSSTCSYTQVWWFRSPPIHIYINISRQFVKP